MNSAWYKTWFDSPYYHLLYRQRDDEEAERFISALVSYLKAEKDDLFLDLCCGRGRHSKFLHGLGYQVYGMDLSERNVQVASKLKGEGMDFEVHDIRQSLGKDKYHHILNLFTSFGYFDKDEEHRLSLHNVYEALKKGGTFTLDFLNMEHVDLGMGPIIKEVEGTRFVIQKFIRDGYLIKDIRFETASGPHHVQEKVRAFDKEELKTMLEEAGLRINAIFGDYDLQPFDPAGSERLIFVCSK